MYYAMTLSRITRTFIQGIIIVYLQKGRHTKKEKRHLLNGTKKQKDGRLVTNLTDSMTCSTQYAYCTYILFRIQALQIEIPEEKRQNRGLLKFEDYIFSLLSSEMKVRLMRSPV
jgi:hypothetical protein